MKKASLLLLVSLSLLGNASHLQAQVLYDNGSAALGSPNGIGFYADTGAPSGSYTEVGDVFTAPTSGTAGAISFSGIYYNGALPGTPPATSDTFVISLYETTIDPTTSEDAPDTSIMPVTSTISELTRVSLGLGNSRTVYEFSGVLDNPLTLTAGTTYYLGISDTTNEFEYFAVSQATEALSSLGYALLQGSTTNFVNTNTGTDPAPAPLSFALSVPEPSGWELLVFGGAVLILARRFVRSLE